MNRREFVKSTGLGSALFLCGFVDVRMPAGSGRRNSALIERSIKADFGTGFRLLSYVRCERKYLAQVEHLGNHYLVESMDLTGWTIVSSSIS